MGQHWIGANIDKATKRIKPIIEALKVGEPVAKASQLILVIWTDADYRAVANKLHLMRPDLNLLFAETPSGFSIAEFDEAQTALPLEKRRPSLSSSYYAVKLKKATHAFADCISNFARFSHLRVNHEGNAVFLHFCNLRKLDEQGAITWRELRY